MSQIAAIIILASVLITAFISGIFGMAGGMILMAVLTGLLPVATAMIVHGGVQMVSNGYRAYLWREHILWPVIVRYALGSTLAIVFLFTLPWRPDKQAVYLMLGLTAMLVWLPRTLLGLDVTKRWQAEIAGFVVQGLNTIAGVAGPLMDQFYVNTDLTRHQIVATKSLCSGLSHVVKVAFWSIPLISAAGGLSAMLPLWLFALAVPLSMLGTTLGGKVLNMMSDVNFKRGMR